MLVPSADGSITAADVEKRRQLRAVQEHKNEQLSAQFGRLLDKKKAILAQMLADSLEKNAAGQLEIMRDIPDFLQKLHDVDTSEVLGVGVARVRASGPRMLAWITYGGPDGIGALDDLGGGTLFSFFYSEGSADARKQSRQSSCIPNPSAQQERATNVRVRRNSRESKRAHIVSTCARSCLCTKHKPNASVTPYIYRG
eukprot:scaffold25386_cov146-Isochrysis_galbana.AAC.1